MGHKKRKCCRRPKRCCPKYSNCFSKGCCVSAWDLQLTAEPTTFTTVGQIIQLRYRITNNGNTQLCGCAELNETHMFPLFLPNFCLDCGQTWIEERPYVITQADLDAGQVAFRAGIVLRISRCKYLSACSEFTITRVVV